MRLASLVVLEKQGHHAHHAWQENFVLAVMTMPPAVKLVRKESTNLWVDKEAASPAFLESTTTSRTGQSASLAPKTNTPTLRSKSHARAVVLVNGQMKEAPAASLVVLERRVHHAFLVSLESFVLAATKMHQRATIVQWDGTSLSMEVQVASLAFRGLIKIKSERKNA